MYLGEKWVGLEVCQRISASTSRQNSARTALQDAVSCTRETNPKYRCTNQQNQHGIHGSKTEKIWKNPPRSLIFNRHPLDLSRRTRGVCAHRTACAWKIPCISGALNSAPCHWMSHSGSSMVCGRFVGHMKGDLLLQYHKKIQKSCKRC